MVMPARLIMKKTKRIPFNTYHTMLYSVKTRLLTIKCRVVFDGSCKTPDGVSLNSCLLNGPKLQPDLVQVLMRFQCRQVALMADIKKMFLQIYLKRKDQNSHRFLWRDMNVDEEPTAYCMTRVTFGDTSSPFLSIATVYMPKITKTYIPKQCKK